jgi:hypothetical protein
MYTLQYVVSVTFKFRTLPQNYAQCLGMVCSITGKHVGLICVGCEQTLLKLFAPELQALVSGDFSFKNAASLLKKFIKLPLCSP